MTRIIFANKSCVRWWHDYKDAWRYCRKCQLHHFRNSVVLYRGRLPADFLFIGEAPGRSEDLLGTPFIGEAGKELDSIIEEVEEETEMFRYGITNIISCIPLDSEGALRQPTKEEGSQCSERLLQLIEKADPKTIFLLGRVAEQQLPAPLPLAEQPRRIYLTHPSAILRADSKKARILRKRVVLQITKEVLNAKA